MDWFTLSGPGECAVMCPIYLDHNASSPIDPRVLEAMAPYWASGGNPESQHSVGRVARRSWNAAKETVAEVLGAYASEVIFTSGGTESNNHALHTLVQCREGLRHIVTSPLEHPAVSEPLAQFSNRGFQIDVAKVNHEGLTNIEDLRLRFQAHTALATVLLAHNETGAIQPVASLAQAASELGIPVHTDAVQAVGRISVDFHKLQVATLAASAHKLHGPCGIGVLLIGKEWKCQPLIFGGRQQAGCRPGTPPVALAVGMATALRLWQDETNERTRRWLELRTSFLRQLSSALRPSDFACNGPEDLSFQLPQTINIGFRHIDGDLLLIQLDQAGICASLGTACASGSMQPSPSLIAMQIPSDRIRSSVRFSFGAWTTKQEVDDAVQRISTVIHHIKSHLPKVVESIN